MRTFKPVGVSRAMDQKLTDFLAGIARARVRALLLDYDGTLAPFSIDPERATPYPEFPPLLERIQTATDTRMVIVSGRPALSARRLLGLPGIEIWGCHGFERLSADGTLKTAEAPAESLQAVADAANLLLNDGLGLFAERKPTSIAIHWRGRESLSGHLSKRVQHAWSQVKDRKGIRLVPFDGGIEITAAARNKGDVVATILSEIGPDAAVAYLGDDTTDEDAFGALQGRGLNVLVREEYRKTIADVWIRPPDEVTAFLSAWAASCKLP